ncbi:MAG: hypothetical protein AAFN30_16905, partial [Actinomycetota bacterium]
GWQHEPGAEVGTPELFVPIVDVYRARWEERGRPWSDARVGACSHIHIGPDDAQARTRWEPHYRQYWSFVGGLLGEGARWPTFDFDELLVGPGICGGADEVLDRIAHWGGALGLDRHLFMFDLGGLPPAQVTDAIERFGAEVLPHL